MYHSYTDSLLHHSVIPLRVAYFPMTHEYPRCKSKWRFRRFAKLTEIPVRYSLIETGACATSDFPMEMDTKAYHDEHYNSMLIIDVRHRTFCHSSNLWQAQLSEALIIL